MLAIASVKLSDHSVETLSSLRSAALDIWLFELTWKNPRASQAANIGDGSNRTSTSMMQRLLETFVWTRSFDPGRRKKRAWMSSAVARASAAVGGLGVPHLTRELQALSVDTVERWCSPSSGLRSAIGAVLLASTPYSTGARRLTPAKPSLQRTLAATGLQLRHAMATVERDGDETELVKQLLPTIGRGSSLDYQWEDNATLRVSYERVAAPASALRQHQAARRGNLNVPALLHAKVIGGGVLVNQAGNSVTKSDFPTPVNTDDRFVDVLGLEWHPAGDLLFTAKKHHWPLTPIAACSFQGLCDSLVLQYPGLLRQRGRPADLTLRPASLDIWHLQPAMSGYDLIWNPAGDAHLTVDRVRSTADATAATRRVLQDSTVEFEAHDWLDHPFALWRGHALPTSHAVKHFLAAGTSVTSQKEATARAQRWHAEHGPIATALDTLSWKGINTLPGSTVAHHLLLHKLKGGRLTSWDTTNHRVGCPHCPLAEAAGGRMSHVFWECPKARQLWRNLQVAWSHVWKQTREDTPHEIFSLSLRTISTLLGQNHDVARLGKPTTEDTIPVHLAVQVAWR